MTTTKGNRMKRVSKKEASRLLRRAYGTARRAWSYRKTPDGWVIRSRDVMENGPLRGMRVVLVGGPRISDAVATGRAGPLIGAPDG